jgi:hypothetical protein
MLAPFIHHTWYGNPASVLQAENSEFQTIKKAVYAIYG